METSLEALVRFWTLPVVQRPWTRAAWFAGLAALCLVRIRIALAGVELFSHDIFAMFDPAWRMLHGQRPHIDFYSHLGVVAYLPTLLGMWLAQGHGQGFAYALGSSLAGCLVGAWIYLVGRQRMASMPLLVLVALNVLIVADPSTLGFSPLIFAPVTTYNRLGYALTAILLIEILLPPADYNDANHYAGGFSSGLSTGLSLFLKLNYFFTAVFLLLALYRCRTQRRSRVHGVASGFLIVFLVAAAYFRFHFLPVARDLLLVMRAKHIKLSFYDIDQILLASGTLLVLALMVNFLLRRDAKGSNALASSLLWSSFIICMAGGMLIFGNFEPQGFPLLRFFAALTVSMMIRAGVLTRVNRDGLSAATLALASLCMFVPIASSIFALGNGLTQKFLAAPHSPAIDATRFHDFVPQGEEWYTNQVNDGLTLLRKYRLPGETVMSLDFTNAFSVTLPAEPPPGGAATLQYGTTFSDLHRPWAGRLFGRANLVMLPKMYSDPTLADNISRLYGAYLEEHFRPVAESPAWRLYRRVSLPDSD